MVSSSGQPTLRNQASFSLRDGLAQGYKQVVLVGHSYGTYLVNRLASEQTDRVAAVVVIGAGYPVPGAGRLRWIFYLPLFVSGLFSAPVPCHSILRRFQTLETEATLLHVRNTLNPLPSLSSITSTFVVALL